MSVKVVVTDVAGPERERESIFVSTQTRVRQILMLRDTPSQSRSRIVSSSQVNGNSEELPGGTVISVTVVSPLFIFLPAAVLCWLLRLSFNIPYCITQHTSDYTTHYIQYNIPQGALEKGMIGWMLSSVLCQIRKTSRSLIIIETIKHFIKQKSALDHRADIDMKAFPPISGWNNRLILAVLLKTTAGSCSNL